MSGHTANWKTSSVVTWCDVILRQWWRPLELQSQISGREDLCLELLKPIKPLLPASRSTWKNTWRDNEEHWDRLFENIAIFPLNMCLAEQRKTAFNLRVIFCSRWFTGNFPAARDSPQKKKTPRKIHKNEIYRAPICPHHPGVEETIHSIWGKSRRKATLSYFASDSSFSSMNLSKISHLLL